MEKKEPILTTTNKEEEVSTSSTVFSKKPLSFKDKIKLKFKKINLTKKQKKFTIAGVICIVLILATTWVTCLLNKDKANVATLTVPKINRTVKRPSVKTEEVKGNWFTNLFSKEDEKIKTIAPSFDIVTMEKGDAVIAGRAGADAIVHILDNGKEIGQEKADENGQWVFIPKRSLPVGNRKLTLFVLDNNGEKIKSKQSAILNVSKKPNNEVAVIMGGNKASTILKAPKGQKIGSLLIEKIDYDEEGNFRVAGKARKNLNINLYMNGKLVSKTTTNNRGSWNINTSFELSNKRQVIRADMLNSKGKVIRRVEYKFTPVLIDGENSMVVIKKGDCLWNLALKEYGKGTNYVVIFEANKSQIKDPDLIYVGQVFTMVKKDSEEFKTLKQDYIEKKKRK